MDYTQILRKPLVSEKATRAKDEANKVLFYVAKEANKIEIKKAVEEAFDVQVEAVNVVKRGPEKRKRFGRIMGQKSGYKKAYISLAPGEKIEFFEGV